MTAKRAILIVDDNVALTKSMALILKLKGHHVVTAHSGKDAIDFVRSQPFDLIIMDIKMHEMNGVEALKEIRKIRSVVSVLMMTAYQMDPQISEAMELGVMGVLKKPFDMEAIFQIIEHIGENISSTA